MNAVDKRVTQLPHYTSRGARIPLSSALLRSPGEVFASDSEAGSECIASKNFRSPSIVSTMLGCVHVSWTAGWRPQQCRLLSFNSRQCGYALCFPQRPRIVLRKKLGNREAASLIIDGSSRGCWVQRGDRNIFIRFSTLTVTFRRLDGHRSCGLSRRRRG